MARVGGRVDATRATSRASPRARSCRSPSRSTRRVLGGTRPQRCERSFATPACREAALSPGFRRLMRPRGPGGPALAARGGQRRRERPRQPSLLRRLASGALSVVPPHGAVAAAVTVDLVVRAAARRRAGRDHGADLGFAQLTEDATLHAPAAGLPRPDRRGGRAAAGERRAPTTPRRPRSAPRRRTRPTCCSRRRPPARLRLAAAAGRGAASCSGCSTRANTVPARIGARLRVPEGVWDQDDPLEPIMAAPEFPEPMYEPLRDLSQDWLLPGLEHVPPNTISVARDERALHRVLHGRAEPRDGARAALARVPDRPARHLLPPVLGPERRVPAPADGRRARGAQGHRGDPHLARGEAPRRRPRARPARRRRGSSCSSAGTC